VLIGLHGAGARERRTYETQADRIELARRKFRRRISGPEAMAVARDNGEAGDLRVAHEIVDFSALCVGRAEIAPAQVCVGAVFRPRLLGQTRGQVLRVGALIQRAQGIRPDFPRRCRALKLFFEPGLLLRPENRLRRMNGLNVIEVKVDAKDASGETMKLTLPASSHQGQRCHAHHPRQRLRRRQGRHHRDPEQRGGGAVIHLAGSREPRRFPVCPPARQVVRLG
jgi:hypothetical protein